MKAIKNEIERAQELKEEFKELQKRSVEATQQMQNMVKGIGKVIEDWTRPLQYFSFYYESGGGKIEKDHVKIKVGDSVLHVYFYEYSSPLFLVDGERPEVWDIQHYEKFIELFPHFVNFMEEVKVKAVERVYELEREVEKLRKALILEE